MNRLDTRIRRLELEHHERAGGHCACGSVDVVYVGRGERPGRAAVVNVGDEASAPAPVRCSRCSRVRRRIIVSYAERGRPGPDGYATPRDRSHGRSGR